MAEAIVWTDVTEDGGVKVSTTMASTMATPMYPCDGMDLKVHYTGTIPGGDDPDTPFDCSRQRKTAFSFTLGEGAVIAGWDEAFKKIAVGERALVEVRPDYAYGDEGHPPVIPPDATLRFDVEVLSASVKKKELHEISAEDKLEIATGHKAKGVELFLLKEWRAARKQFAEAIHYCDASTFTRNDKPLPEPVAAVYLSAHLNASQCALNDREWAAAAAYAKRAVKLDPTNVKALFRRGVARSHMGALEEAREDLLAAATLDPKNKAVRAAYGDLKRLFVEQKKGAKKTFSGAFDKVSLFADKPSNLAEPSETANPYAFLRLRAAPLDGEGSDLDAIDGTVAVRVFEDSTPKTAKNFLALCRGDKGRGRVYGKPLKYEGTPIHRVAKSFMIQGGDVVKKDGTSGESIYGKTFADEHFKLKFDVGGRLAMASDGGDSNASQFFITTDTAPHLDGKHVVFGQLVAGSALVKQIADLEADADGKPKLYSVTIAECGALNPLTAAAMMKEEEAELAAKAIADTKAAEAKAAARAAKTEKARKDAADLRARAAANAAKAAKAEEAFAEAAFAKEKAAGAEA